MKLLLPLMERKVKNYAGSHLDSDDQRDCISQTVSHWWKHKDRLPEDPAKLQAYVLKSLHDFVVDSIRKKTKTDLPYREGSVPSWKYSPETVLSREYQASQRERLVEVCLDEIEKLGAKTRQVLRLKYLEGVPDAEVRAQMGYQASSAHPKGGSRYEAYGRILWRARKLLKERVLARLRDAKDPLFDLVSDSELPFFQNEEL